MVTVMAIAVLVAVVVAAAITWALRNRLIGKRLWRPSLAMQRTERERS